MRVLVVEDSHDVSDMLIEVIQLIGHQTLQAFDGQSAIEMADAYVPDVMLLDIGLPDMSGLDVARAIRSNSSGRIFIIAVSGWGQAQDIESAMEAGADMHLTKPASVAKLREVFSRVPTVNQ